MFFRLVLNLTLVGLVVSQAACKSACLANNECCPTHPPDHTLCPRCDLRENTCQEGFGCGCLCSVNTDCDQSDQETTCSMCHDLDNNTLTGRCRHKKCNYGCQTDDDCQKLTYGSCPVCFEQAPGVKLCRPNDDPPPDTCGGPTPPPPPSPLPAECSYNLDNIFLMDASGSIDQKSWRIERQVVLEIGQNFTFGTNANETMMSIVQFSTRSRVFQHLTGDANHFFQTLQTMQRISGKTDTKGAFAAASHEFQLNGRPKDYKTVVLLTDGKPTTGDPVPAAAALKANGVRIFAVAVGKFDSTELALCTSKPLDQHFYTVPTWSQLPPVIHDLVEQMCNRTSVQ